MKQEHVITIWVEGDLYEEVENDLQNIFHDNGMKITHTRIKTFPWKDIHHEIVWWITRKLTLKEWSDLDNKESDVLSEIAGEDNFMGTAGPIPFED